jgi:acylaminoacyl-peptidase
MGKLMSKILVVMAMSGLLLGLVSTAQGNSGKLEIGDIFDLESATDPQISPDGKQIVYVRQFADIMKDKRYSNLWIINFDGSGHRPLTSGHQNDGSPRWSPDGSQIIYTSNKEGSSQIYKRYMDTGQTVVLTNVQKSPGSLAWSPDAETIAFTMNVPEKPPAIAQMPPAPPGAEWAQPARVVDRLVYRYDKRGYLNGYRHLFVLPADGGTPRQLSVGNFDHASQPVWTPDGKCIVMSVNRREDAELENRDTEIYQFAVSDGAIKALSKRKGPDNGPVVSPDGKHIAYTGFDDRYQGFQLTNLYVMGRDGSNPRVLISNLDRSIRGALWSGDSRGLYFRYDDKGVSKLAYATLDGNHRTVAERLGRGAYTIARNGNFAFTYTWTDTPSDIAVGSLSNPDARVITAVNEDLFSYKKLGEVEEIWYESSHDGRKIHGWFIKPPDFDPSKKYPMIIGIHGGPFSNYGFRFNLEQQFMAASGYVVLYTNPRGSTSYGEEFGNLIHHAYPGKDFYDLNSGVDAMIAKGFIDEDRLYVTGGSGGGVLTCWMVGNTDRFRAAVSLYPVINWYSWSLTSDIQITGVKYWFPGYPWENAEHYETRNLLSKVGNVKTPTMLICGEHDWRCPISETEQYYAALKLRGVEAVMVRVPNEPHGISQRPSHHISKIQHIIGWFDKHNK